MTGRPAPDWPAMPRGLTVARKPRLLWANPYCLLDTSSGASMSVREMLRQLVKYGYEVQILGATIFDAEKGLTRLQSAREQIQASNHPVLHINDPPLMHRLVRTASIHRRDMKASEEIRWFALYTQLLDTFKPDLVWFYGGQTLDLLIADEARARGIPSAAYLVNGRYHGARWCRDVDLIVTDSQATAGRYAQTEGFRPVPLGTFIDPGPVLARQNSRKHITFINPSLEKGAAIVILLALILEQRRPDIIFEVVESRGNWHGLVKAITANLGKPREALSNVVVTPNSLDMRPIYGRTRLLLAPSLFWESGARVLAEAMLNGIPAIVSNQGGSPEMIGDGGIRITLPPQCHQKPYTACPTSDVLEPLIDRIESLFDDEAAYQTLCRRALHVGQTRHSLETSTQRLIAAFRPLIEQRAGDRDHAQAVRRVHKQI